MSDPTKPLQVRTTADGDLVLIVRLVLDRDDLRRLVPGVNTSFFASSVEHEAMGDRLLSVGVLLSCAMDALCRGDGDLAAEQLRGAATVARRIDAARSEGITS